MDEQERAKVEALAEKVVACAYEVSNTLGVGFLEKVYENALTHELSKAGISSRQQHQITVRYDDVVVGEYCADLLVGDALLVELKVAKALDDIHLAQCLNYLKATGKTLCMLINFGRPKVEIKRVVLNH